MSDKILPCPFCGCETIRVHKRTCDKDTPYNPADRAYPLVRCYGCGASAEGDDWTDIDTAINRWNRRAPAVPVVGGGGGAAGAPKKAAPGATPKPSNSLFG